MENFDILLWVMVLIAVIVFICLYKIEAGYGIFTASKWGTCISNKLAWILMECPVFIVMMILWTCSERQFQPASLIFFLLFEFHYFQRSFIFPLLMRGHGKMPIAIMLMGIVFNVINGYIQGRWIFYLAPEHLYDVDWLITPQFIIGIVVFMVGMGINLQADYIIRHLRKPGDKAHYLPSGGMYNYVTSANYFGEIVEWTGFAIMTWSFAGLVFVIWTFANLVPRSNSIYSKYKMMFGSSVQDRHLKRIFPFIY